MFRYKEQIITNPTSGIEETYAYPWLPCILEWGARRTTQMEGLLDSGSDGVVIPLDVARFLGLNLKMEEKPMRVAGGEVPRYSARVNLTIGRGGRFYSFPNVEVAVPVEGDTPVLIGRNPVFETYKVTFDDAKRKFILDPH